LNFSFIFYFCKKINNMSKLQLIFVSLFLAISFSSFSQVGIGTDSPNASAALDITSTTSGFLPPRMSEAERILIDAPVAGLIIWCSNCGTKGELQVYNGTEWTHISGVPVETAITVPGAPTIGIATAQNEEATITFTAPTDNGGSTITTYTAISSPDGITGTISQAGSGEITVIGLTNGTEYTFTVTATNAIGTSAASAASNSITLIYPEGTATDQDGNIFEWKNYGALDWAIENAEVITYLDGTPISNNWSNDNNGWVIQDQSQSNNLYNWYAVAGIYNNLSLNDPSLRKKIAPNGWRVATDSDWSNFKDYLMSTNYNCDASAEDKLAKSISSTQGWENSIHACSPGKDPLLNNHSGFNALPNRSINPNGGYGLSGQGFIFWSSSEYSSSNAWYYYVNNTGKYIARDKYFNKNGGYSVRFVRDATSL
jgi:uncharacterized protein (TIGR02145 family)